MYKVSEHLIYRVGRIFCLQRYLQIMIKKVKKDIKIIIITAITNLM